jgi:hypothetical protein
MKNKVVYKENLIVVLNFAIREMRAREKLEGFKDDSALVVGIQELVDHVLADGQLTIKELYS